MLYCRLVSSRQVERQQQARPVISHNTIASRVSVTTSTDKAEAVSTAKGVLPMYLKPVVSEVCQGTPS